MTIEINHLAAYLPYRLHFKTTHSKYQGIYVLQEMNQFGGVSIKDSSLPISRIRPILRPLTDLENITQEDGTCINVLLNIYATQIMDREVISKLLHAARVGWINSDEIPYGVIKILCSWHFDIFNLLRNNLAISIRDVDFYSLNNAEQ
jgi:hypothetical protein